MIQTTSNCKFETQLLGQFNVFLVSFCSLVFVSAGQQVSGILNGRLKLNLNKIDCFSTEKTTFSADTEKIKPTALFRKKQLATPYITANRTRNQAKSSFLALRKPSMQDSLQNAGPKLCALSDRLGFYSNTGSCFGQSQLSPVREKSSFGALSLVTYVSDTGMF